MIQKQQASSLIETFLEFYSTQQFIQEILRQTHHMQMINYRHELTFEKYFKTFLRPTNHDQAQACDILIFSQSTERLQKYNKMNEIVGSIRAAVLNRVKKDQIAPILCCNQNENRIINKVQRLYRAGINQMRGSNTMHTESSLKNTRSKYLKVENTIILNQKTYTKGNRNQDFSTQTLSKVAQDLSKMIQQVYITQNKSKDFNFKISNSIFAKNTINRAKFPKKKFFETNISIIKKSTHLNNNSGHFFDDPDENYGLKKFKINSISKNRETSRNKQKVKSILCSDSKISKKNFNQNKKKQQMEKIRYSPLTPKPISISKIRMGWGESLNKNSRHSSKSYTEIAKKSSKKLLKPPNNNNNKVAIKKIKSAQKNIYKAQK